MATWALQAITLTLIIAFACFCVVFSVITIMYYWKHYCKGTTYGADGDVPWNFLQPSWWWKFREYLYPKESKKSEVGTILKLPFDIPYEYEMYLDKGYSSRDNTYFIKIKCPDLKIQFMGKLEIGPRKDGTWGYTSFELGRFNHINYKERYVGNGESLLPYGTSLFAVDKKMKEIIKIFENKNISTNIDSYFKDEWSKWLAQVDNFEAMKGHNEINKK